MYFAGRLPRPPVETRTRVDASCGGSIACTSATRARDSASPTLQSRFAKLVELWESHDAVREEGRGGAGPKVRRRDAPPATGGSDAQRRDSGRPSQRAQGPRTLRSLSSARHAGGRRHDSLPKFVDLLKDADRQPGHVGRDEVGFGWRWNRESRLHGPRREDGPDGEGE
jgi:hypothetical protein